MNSPRNKRLCPDTAIALMADGDTFRVGYVERKDLFGNAVVNYDGYFEVWPARSWNGNHLFLCAMDEHTQQYSRCNNHFVSLHQKEIAIYAIAEFVNKELRKQQQGSIYREELPIWARLYDNNQAAPFSTFETPNAPNLSVPFPSTWRNDPLTQQSVAQQQFKDLWKAPEQKPFLDTQQLFRTHDFQPLPANASLHSPLFYVPLSPQFGEPSPDKSVTMKPVQSAPPGTFGKLYPEQWDMIQELVLEAKRVKTILEIRSPDQTSVPNENPEADSPSLHDDELDALIRTIFLENGFTIKEGETDLKQYVFTAAKALIAAVANRKTAGR